LSYFSTYRANGKLLLTGEYLVLQGAKAIALPLKVGQQMVVSEVDKQQTIFWQAKSQDEIWFKCILNPVDLRVLETSDLEKSDVLRQLFKTIETLDRRFALQQGLKFETMLESNPEWGFGSSSTLVSLLSQWCGVDPFRLNELVFSGSGFDIACATANGPIMYVRNKLTEPVDLDYLFADQLFLVYSGRKKGTALEVRSFLNNKVVSEQKIAEMNVLSEKFASCSSDQSEFNRLIQDHEKMIGQLIRKNPVKDEFFPNFEGEIKSLGAWGGDFYLVSTQLPFWEVKKYFENKGLTTVFRWDDLILKRR